MSVARNVLVAWLASITGHASDVVQGTNPIHCTRPAWRALLESTQTRSLLRATRARSQASAQTRRAPTAKRLSATSSTRYTHQHSAAVCVRLATTTSPGVYWMQWHSHPPGIGCRGTNPECCAGVKYFASALAWVCQSRRIGLAAGGTAIRVPHALSAWLTVVPLAS
jgi:hypothetical protein